MAQKRLSGNNDDAIDVTPDDISDLEEDFDDDLSQIFAEFGSSQDDRSFKIKVYRIIPDKGEMAWLFDCVPSELPISNRLRDEYGGGNFELRVYENSSGRMRLKKKPRLVIEAPRKVEQATQTDLATLLKAMQEQQREMFAQLSDVMQRSSGMVNVPTSPFAMMKEMATAMVSMKEMMQPQQNGNGFEMLLKGVELAKELNNGGSESSFIDLLRDVVKPMAPFIGEAVQQQMQEAKKAPKLTPVLPNASAPPPGMPGAPQPGAANEQGNSDMQSQMISRYLNMLVNKAAAGAEPELYAELVLDNLPEQTIREQLLVPGILDELAKVNPGVNVHRDWFERLQTALQTFLNDNVTPPGEAEQSPPA